MGPSDTDGFGDLGGAAAMSVLGGARVPEDLGGGGAGGKVGSNRAVGGGAKHSWKLLVQAER